MEYRINFNGNLTDEQIEFWNDTTNDTRNYYIEDHIDFLERLGHSIGVPLSVFLSPLDTRLLRMNAVQRIRSILLDATHFHTRERVDIEVFPVFRFQELNRQRTLLRCLVGVCC